MSKFEDHSIKLRHELEDLEAKTIDSELPNFKSGVEIGNDVSRDKENLHSTDG